MALYQFECEACGHVTERLTHKTDPNEVRPLECPACGMMASQRLRLGPSKLEFKGVRGRSGFHSVDYGPTKQLTKKSVHAVGAPKGGTK